MYSYYRLQKVYCPIMLTNFMTFYKKAYEYSDEQTCLPISIAASVEVMSEVKERMGNYLQTTGLQGKY